MDSRLPISIREMRAGDSNLIIQSWTRHARTSHHWMPRKLFLDVYRRAVLAAIDTSPTWIACNPGLDDQIFGWACADPARNLVHFVYVKHKFRRLGIARRLLDEIRQESSRRLTPTNWTDDLDLLKVGCLQLGGYRPDLFNPPRPREIQ